MESGWHKNQWIYLYIFSDEANALKGFGAYVPGVGAEYFE